MTTPPNELPAQLGLLDLSVDLSVPEVYSGTDFTLYLHIKNPFAQSTWIDSVELSLPTQLLQRPEGPREPGRGWQERRAERKAVRQIVARDRLIADLNEELLDLADTAAPEARRTRRRIEELEAENRISWLKVKSQLHVDSQSGTVNIDGHLRNVRVTSREGTVNVTMRDSNERARLIGSLPAGAALEPGCTDVWTIRLGTGRGPFFIPAKYHLQMTVIYGFEAGPAPARADSRDDPPQVPPAGTRRRIFSNTTSCTVPVKSALRNVMLGGVVGGLVGSAARSLQSVRTDGFLSHGHPGVAAVSLALSAILSWAAIIFSARKSEAQSFITVEDFWGGLLVGFLIGYSGTAAFTEITGLKS
ncbi:hypothetical protein [Streptomyces sp. TLI_171]|uniref:hypothetical protein n=1 Tax=Streptomyces sp. TLI_171 TaxID=1938859 RepID=UPI000C63A7A9|nr:hypothetical protein [Streptomyces sp. TLI_171]RKE22954.1 hypothetical protein BX266_6410 [Streptomyces sp. TLI_171]